MSKFPPRADRQRKRAYLTAVAGCTAATLVLTACGNAQSSTSSAPDGMPSSGEVMFFGQSRENPYFGQNEIGAREVAESYGWDVSYVEASTQEEQDSAIQQMLAQGAKPVGVVLNPISGEAAVASEQAIKAAGIPLVILNQVPTEEQDSLFDAYAGVNDYGSGRTAAQLLIAGAQKAGVPLGDGLIVNTVAGHTAAQQRVAGFTDELKQSSPSSAVLSDVTSGGFLEAEGYSIGSQVIPANKGKFTWVYGVNDALALGAIRAAKENGILPGKDALFVGGTCMNANTNAAVINGELVGSAIQSPLVEGQSAIYALAAYLNNGSVLDGDADLSADAPPSIDTPPHKRNFMPNTKLDGTAASFDSTTIWGRPASELCNYS
ncbi:sugar ABC transporter substrate-binding protein [Rhodococcus jostii]|uniref:Sugar ABC transporter substrate-binding protein n=1 Tax=Rhodococcus jostii TaxID=132919 RepID=A0ABU4CE91_RHOJO|nr:sugar ABC transporter substrate-binding protein [Rhodococcus jostii]MDV6281748.1 sugar ABC transporter substrate-binding protein [Rhodococcus jostii]